MLGSAGPRTVGLQLHSVRDQRAFDVVPKLAVHSISQPIRVHDAGSQKRAARGHRSEMGPRPGLAITDVGLERELTALSAHRVGSFPEAEGVKAGLLRSKRPSNSFRVRR